MSELKPTISEEIILSSKGYILQKILGEGAYAKVYLTEFSAKADTHKTTLACKIIETSKAPRDFVVKFLPREIVVLRRLKHPHLIHVHSIFQRKTKYYIFMRFSENGDLLGYILKNGCVSENQSRLWFRQLALGLQYLHELHIAHRDIKCENVLLTANFNVKLSDFGFARFCIDESNDANILSETYCGSLSYAAPEILYGKPYLPKPTDLWSLGVVLFVMLNKSMPFDDTRLRNTYEQQMGKKYRFRSRVGSTVSLECKCIVKHLLEPDPGLRHSAHQVLSSDWIAMDSRLTSLNAVEAQALKRAREDNRKTSASQPFPKQDEILDEGKRRGLFRNPGTHGTVVNTTNGECVVDVGGYVFNTESHPIDPTKLYCCQEARQGINKSEVHKMYQQLEKEDNIKLMPIIEDTIKDNAVNVSKETPQEGGLNI